MTRLLLWLPAIALSALASSLTGCDSTTASANPAASTSAQAFDEAVYCHSVCERATFCGIEDLEKTVKATAADVGVLNKARANAAETIASCEKTCNVPPAEAEREALADAERCLQQSGCEGFASCLGTVEKR